MRRMLLQSMSLFIALLGVPMKALAYETAQYKVVHQYENFGIRTYPAQVVAEVMVSGTRDEAASEGFSLLAGYILVAMLIKPANQSGCHDNSRFANYHVICIPIKDGTQLDASWTGPASTLCHKNIHWRRCQNLRIPMLNWLKPVFVM